MTFSPTTTPGATVATPFEALGDAVSASAPRLRADRSIDRRHWQEAAQLGLWTAPVPQNLGGDGLGWPGFVDRFRELCSRTDDLGFLLSGIAHAGALRALLELGTDDQKQRFLPYLTSGGIASTAFTEPGGGSDVQQFKATAVPDADGWVLNGLKSHITNAPVADLIIALVRVEDGDDSGLTLVIFEADRVGVRRDPPEVMLGAPTSPTGDLLFDRVLLDRSDLLGHVGRGLRSAFRMFCFDRALYALVAAEAQANMARRSLRHCRSRSSFGVDLADHQYVQGRLVDMITGAVVSSTLAERALGSLDRALPTYSSDASIAKLVATEHLVRSAGHAMQLRGHAGYLDGELSWSVADSLATLIAGGTSDIQRKNIFSQFERNEGRLW